MAFGEFTNEEVARMREIQQHLERELMKFNQRKTEALLPVAALIICARKLIDLYPEPRRSAVVEGVRMFLEKENPDQLIIPFSTLLQ